MEEITKFLEVSYGFGIGSGFDASYGDGDGYGFGESPGYGLGFGCGKGCGNGSGYGFGYGFGYGCDCGKTKSFNGNKVYAVDNVDTIIESVHGNYAKGFILNTDLTLTPTYIARVGDSFAHGETLKKAVEDATEKDIVQRPLNERIDDFVKQHPKGHKFPASDYCKWHHILTGSCEQGRKSFMLDKGIKDDDMYSPEEFISITSNAYGGDVISKLKKKY